MQLGRNVDRVQHREPRSFGRAAHRGFCRVHHDKGCPTLSHKTRKNGAPKVFSSPLER